MADYLNIQDLQNAHLDAKTLEQAVNTDADIISRLGAQYPSLPRAIDLLMQKSPVNSVSFATVSAMQASTTADNTFAFVYADVGQNNGLYLKTSGKWSKSNYSPVAYDFVPSTNIFDKSAVTQNKYVDYLSGDIGTATNYTATDFCIVKSNAKYRVSDFYTQQFAFYDESKKYISGMVSANSNHEFTTPPNAAFARFTVPSSQIDTLVITESALFPADYLPYKIKKTINDLEVNANQVIGLNNIIEAKVGLQSVNIINKANVINGYYVSYLNGQIGNNTDFVATDYCPVKPNTKYKVSDFYTQQFAFYDANKAYISGMVSADSNHEFTTPANAAFVRFSIPKTQINAVIVAESTIFSDAIKDTSKYIDGLVVPDTSSIKTTEIIVSADVNDATAAFKGNNAIQNALDSITDATAKNRYVIRVKKGLYKITKANEFLGYRGYPAMILTKDHVDIIGQGEDNTIVWAELPYDDAQIGASVDGNTYPRSSYQTVYDYADDSEIRDITFVAKNLRYTIHIDNPNGADKTRRYKNVGYLFKGDKGSLTAMGCGTSTGEHTHIVGGRSLSDSNVPFASHNNIAFDKPSFWSFKGHNFTSLAGKYAVYMQNDGSLLQDQLELVGCSFGGMAYILGYVDVWLSGNTSKNYDSFNHAEWKFTGYGNEPFLFANEVAGKSLLFKTTATGLNNSIRFDTSSSAYSLLIKNNQSNADAALYIDSRDYIDGYIVQDGSTGLPAQAWGCRDLSESVYLYDKGINYTSLAKRLGNCTSNNKTLGVIVNGVTKSIVFNKDYSSMTNAQVIADMQAQMTDVTISLLSYGRDYYPLMPDVAETVYNNGSTYIAKGSIVTKQAGFVKLAQASDKVYGVALDDIPVMSITSEGVRKGQGRVLKRGYISANRGNAHFALADNQNPAIGTRFSLSNGQLVTDSNGKISVDIDSGIVSINC